MALPATDTFTSASDQDLVTYSANCAYNAGDFGVLGASDDVRSTQNNTECGARWAADAFNNDQYAQCICKAVSANGAGGVGVRHGAAGVHSYYGYYTDNAASYLFKVVTATFTQLGSNGAVWLTDATVYRLEVSGTSVRPMKGGATADIGAQTDSALSSGSAGLTGYHTTTTRVDNWEGGDLGGAAATFVGWYGPQGYW